jgi:hypothetical protein
VYQDAPLTLDQANGLLTSIHDSYNHERHNVTKMKPYELHHGRTDDNFNRPSDLPRLEHRYFSEEEYAAMIVLAIQRMRLRSAKDTARRFKALRSKGDLKRLAPLLVRQTKVASTGHDTHPYPPDNRLGKQC